MPLALALAACGGSAPPATHSVAPPVVRIAVSPAQATVQAGASVQLTAQVTGAADTAAAWSVREAGGGAVSGAGLYTAPAAAGVFHVVSVSHADPSQSAEAEITVTAVPQVVSVRIDPPSVSLTAGATVRFTATVSGSADTAVSWTAPDGGAVDATGLFTAPSAAGTFHVVATSHADASKSATATAAVVFPGAITIAPKSATVSAGDRIAFQATLTALSDPRVRFLADGGAVDATGAWTAPMLGGTVRVTAQSVADPSLQDVATVTVKSAVVVKVQPGAVFSPPGSQVQLSATVTGASDTSVTWSIAENPTNGSIDDNGVFTIPWSPNTVWHVVATSNADPAARDVAAVDATDDMLDHGGAVAADVHAYAFFWGNPATFATDLKGAVESFLGAVGGTPYLAIADQYLRGARASVTFAGSLVDTSAPPATSPDAYTIGQEVCAKLAAQGQDADPKGLYFVFTDNAPPIAGGWCAWHSSTFCGNTRILVTLVPNPGRNCTVPDLACSQLSLPSLSSTAFVAHELMESITDPYGDGWWGGRASIGGSEIGDKCDGRFSGCVPMGGMAWQVQEQWSNAVHGCVRQ